ncbi:GNAT family N-acetyltransferase [Mesorhizobium sp. M2D.F.Ca.ET.185.01.1.1]|uniref:GNAT family N-acetyltransferase n=1 Tax=unclassified Mesorhizobium TaxID=325217 RepID=UPI000F75866B|nr:MULTISPECIES: GNAT family N-acetyltransferase [unclassified Mesorhizobium]TGP77265.1 GNAT family N-acetyltransferase [bacterium M00.F.Ca.ET.227.01.1.1]TGP93058.1 GNAT family N-acetyltransferase [bacterium M00.F.Ca.ET.222.01.1.1]TGP96604.1 GNAT family N-acetyltransferase [bacterium M00.F.Ca.ET.221.01.1.1]TGT95986.1 GNAT family N-acetyltransferase [bacterium M00.F.Ca.ET.163.01.1.1]TGU20765.1 GNAT family N-acetyltransferase [bacterium M00.F.Ca.ET.156.01.1.1]TGU49816.1 GNAT family N-acetyltran
MSLPPWHEEAIARSHDRKAFDCGDVEMNAFLQRFARQGHEQNAVKSFCAVPDDAPEKILGFYSLAPASVEHHAVPPPMTKGLARHDVPGFLLARLAVDKSVAGRGLGGQLLLAAALRCIRVTEEVGGVLMIIDAKSSRAASWYASYGAEPLNDRPMTLVVPLKTFAETLKASGHL